MTSLLIAPHGVLVLATSEPRAAAAMKKDQSVWPRMYVAGSSHHNDGSGMSGEVLCATRSPSFPRV